MRKLFLLSVTVLFLFAVSGTVSAADKELLSLFGKDAEQRYIKDVEFIVNTDTGGLDESSLAGRNTAMAFLKKRCESLGATTFVRIEESTKVPHLVCELKGNNQNGKNIVLMSHFDTVMRPTKDYKFSYDQKSGIMKGPGVADSQTSVIQMLYVMEALKNWKSKNLPFKAVRIWFDGAEDGPGFGPVRTKLGEELTEWADVTLITDSGRPSTGIVSKRKGQANCTVDIKGIQGHSGNAPHVAASATMELGQVLNKIHQMSQNMDEIRIPKAPGFGSGNGFEKFGPGGIGHDPKKYTPAALKAKGVTDVGQYINECSINVGVVSTKNQAGNVIPSDAQAQMNIRCYSPASYEKVRKELYAIKPTIMGTEVKIACADLGSTYDGGDKTPKGKFNITNTEVLNAYKTVMKKEFGLEVTEWLAGGFTIANDTNKTRATLDALGVDADPTLEHGPEEYVDIKTVAPRVLALTNLIVDIDKMGK